MNMERGSAINPGLRKLLALILDSYAFALIIYLIVRLITADYLWPFEIISAFSHWILLMALVLLPLAIWLKRWHTMVLLALGSAAFVWLFGGLFLPRSIHVGSHHPDADACTFTVMTYNLGNGLAAPDDVKDAITASSVDIVGFQDFSKPQIAQIRSKLQETHPYQVTYESGFSGIGIFSRFPILEEERFTLYGSRPYLKALIADEDCTVRVIVAHPVVAFGPGASQSPARADIPEIAKLISDEQETILFGDLNFSDQNEGYAKLKDAGWVDAHRGAGLGFGLTYPRRTGLGSTRFPLVRIDYILVTPGIQPLRSWVGEDAGSDHLPVLAEISWPQGNVKP
jgi:endonuclease/exonuclease/phosphatase family metal-dependent hydrolase